MSLVSQKQVENCDNFYLGLKRVPDLNLPELSYHEKDKKSD
jgi:hypothetical protein